LLELLLFSVWPIVIISEELARALASEIGFAIHTDMAVLYVTLHGPMSKK
jgi:hypothetical protein